LTENVLGYILGDFFTNSSGRTAASAGADGRSSANTKLCQKSQKLQSTTVRRNDHGLDFLQKKFREKIFRGSSPSNFRRIFPENCSEMQHFEIIVPVIK
jgi:hypothetical protein